MEILFVIIVILIATAGVLTYVEHRKDVKKEIAKQDERDKKQDDEIENLKNKSNNSTWQTL